MQRSAEALHICLRRAVICHIRDADLCSVRPKEQQPATLPALYQAWREAMCDPEMRQRVQSQQGLHFGEITRQKRRWLGRPRVGDDETQIKVVRLRAYLVEEVRLRQ